MLFSQSGLFQIYNGSQFLIEPVKAHKDQEIHEQPLQKEHVISTHNPDYQAPPPTTGVDQPQTCGTKMSGKGNSPSFKIDWRRVNVRLSYKREEAVTRIISMLQSVALQFVLLTSKVKSLVYHVHL